MTIKKYFENNSFSNNSLTDLESKEGVDFESFEYLEELEEQRTRFVPNVDFSKPENFAFYGLAEQYYKDAASRIINNYPYDGSRKELLEWYNNSTYFDLYVFENEHPRTTGYAVGSAQGWAFSGSDTTRGEQFFYPTVPEYISVKGGPNPGPSGSFEGGNKYDVSKNRNSNLALNLSSSGNAIELWYKLDQSFGSPIDQTGQTIFEAWNGEEGASKGLVTLYGYGVQNTAAADGFLRLRIQSGSAVDTFELGNVSILNTIREGDWNHLAVSYQDQTASLYFNGALNTTSTTTSSLGDIGGAIRANIGGFVSGSIGAGKLIGSVDEFRFWKTARTGRDIERNWFTNIYGGTNTDDANTDLGVYFKFNEGITGDSSTDSIVLDYSGRISNGTWVGYSTGSRNTGSAFEESTFAYPEFKDPILRTTNPRYTTYYNSAVEKGKRHDLNNSSNVYYSFPDWIVDEDLESGSKLLQLAQAVSSYFDTLQLQVGSLRQLKDIEYSAQTSNLDDKPTPFADRLLTERGMIAPDLFVERTVLEDLSQKDNERALESDLFDLKNLIYQNIYNNLADLTKKKGTKEAIRNLLNTFGVGEELIATKTYIDGEKLLLEDERKVNNQSIKYIDFFKENFRDASIYQTGSVGGNDQPYISGSANKTRLCVESFVRFPKIDENTAIDDIPNFTTSSLFGFHDVEESPPYSTWQNPSTSSVFVRAVKDRVIPELVYFEMSSSVSAITALTSSKFNDVYNNSDWYFSVQVIPQDTPSFASSSAPDYNIVFSGYSYAGNNLQDSFSVSSSIARAGALAFVQSNQKVYIGAERTNFTAGLIHKSDVRNAGLRFWLRDLSTEEQKAHAQDFLNYGSLTRLNNDYALQDENRNFDLAPEDYLALRWQFDKITTTDASGSIDVLDSTSGSADRRNRGSYVDSVAGYHHRGAGNEFPTSSSDVVQTLFVDSYSPDVFDGYNSDNLVQVKQSENEQFGLNQRFVSFITTVEKSAQAGIDEEMLKMFGSVKELASYFAQPVERYRKEYKNLRFLRERFFKNVSNDVDVEDYLHFYKWIDNSLQAAIAQFVPATADHNKDVFTVIESHVLERNKYQNKFPTLELRQPDPEGSAKSINSQLINWRLNHAPIPLAQNTHSPWWKIRASRSGSLLTSGDTGVDSDREQIRLVKESATNRSYTSPQRFTVDELYSGKQERKANYWDAAIQEFGPIVDVDGPGPLTASVSADYLLVRASNVYGLLDSSDVLDPNKKVKRTFKIENSREYNGSYSYGKGHLLAPFTLWSSSVDTGYQSELGTNFKSNIGLNNHHDDNYSNFINAPLQSPFTQGWVGGRQYRHVALNNGSDANGTRPEGFYLLAGPDQAGSASLGVVKTTYTSDGTHDFNTPRASFFREELAKRPVNIKNRQYSTASSRLGNFRKTYEVVMTNGRTKNNLWFHDNASQVLTETEIWGLNRGTASPYLNATLPTRGVVKSIIVNRFSAPGGPEIQSRGYLEPTGEELSPYNAYPFRNTSVLLSSGSNNNNFTGSGGPRVNIHTSIHTSNDGLRSLLSRHSGKFGVDSVYGSVRAGDYNTTASYVKVNRNPISQSTGINYDNFFATHQIPRTPAGYSWIRAIQSGTSGSFAYSRTATRPSGSTSETAPFTQLATSIQQGGASEYSRAFTGLLSGSTPTSAYLTSSLLASIIDQGSTEITNELTINSLPSQSFGVYAHGINNSIFGHNTFTQIRNSYSPQVRSFKKNNLLSFKFQKGAVDSNDREVATTEVKNISMAPVVQHYPTKQQLFVNGRTVNFQYTFGNELEYLPFSDSDLNGAATGLREIRRNKKTNFNYISDLYTGKLPYANGELRNLVYKQRIWPKAENTFRKENRQRTNFEVNWWSTGRSTRTRNDVQNSMGETVLTQSIWALDGCAETGSQPKHIFNQYTASITNDGVVGTLADAYPRLNLFDAGELQNNGMFNYCIVGASGSAGAPISVFAPPSITDNDFKFLFMESKVKPNVVYARPFSLFSSSFTYVSEELYTFYNVDGIVPTQIVGGTPWSAAEEAGKEPFYYKDYNAYAQEIKAANKDFSVIPEFRISEKIDEILTGDEGENTLLSPMLSLTGGSAQNDSSENFYTDFVNSDFLKYFNVIEQKHDDAEIDKKGTLNLSCKAVKKFLPYEGFYPAQRILQLGTLFSQSFSSIVQTTGSGSPLADGSVIYVDFPPFSPIEQTFTSVNEGGSFRTALIPFISPGILCNSIKSGISLGYPILTSSFNHQTQVTGTYLSSSTGASVFDSHGARISASFNSRLDFESITDPLAFITTIYDTEPGENSILSSSATYNSGESGDGLYNHAVNNFLAETMNLFLKNRSVSSLVSAGENNFTFNPNKQYRMKLRLFEEGLSMYDGDRSFGAPVDDSQSLNGSRASFLPYLPPYDVGAENREEGIELIFNPTSEIHNVDFILNNLTESFTIYNDLGISIGSSFAIDDRTKITDSIDIKRKVRTGFSSRAVPSAPEFAMSIQPKWECPVLDFSHRTASVSISNTNATINLTPSVPAAVGAGGTLTFQLGVASGSMQTFTFIASGGTPAEGEIELGASTPEQTATNMEAAFNRALSVGKARYIQEYFDVSRDGATVTLTAKNCGPWTTFSATQVANGGTKNPLGSIQTTNGTGFLDNSTPADNYYVGMWHQYGRIPTGSQGIKMQITEPIITDTTASLAQALGFSNEAVKIGEIADTRTVKEAIVAIPYRIADGEKRLYNINAFNFVAAKNYINRGSRQIDRPNVRQEFINLAQRMKDYVLPPKYDFFYRPSTEVQPFAMFVFEFDMQLNRQDLSDIWQNLPPTSTDGKKDLAGGFDKQTSNFKVTYGEEGSWFPEGIPSDTRWMVFKVKQRAAYDYYEQVRQSSFAQGLTSKVAKKGSFVDPTYSYNWPYDFFSFVELAKIDAEMEVNNIETTGGGPEQPIVSDELPPETTSREELDRQTELSENIDSTGGVNPRNLLG